jgi:hypothetical protein
LILTIPKKPDSLYSFKQVTYKILGFQIFLLFSYSNNRTNIKREEVITILKIYTILFIAIVTRLELILALRFLNLNLRSISLSFERATEISIFPPDLSSLHDNKQHDSMVHILLCFQASPFLIIRFTKTIIR